MCKFIVIIKAIKNFCRKINEVFNTLIPYCFDKSLKLISIGFVSMIISLSLMFS